MHQNYTVSKVFSQKIKGFDYCRNVPRNVIMVACILDSLKKKDDNLSDPTSITIPNINEIYIMNTF